MAAFQGSDFAIDLPTGATDESTYAFALPARQSFRPSVVVKTDRLSVPTELGAYVTQQLEKIAAALPHMQVLKAGPARHERFSSHASLFEWGEPDRRVRQKQYYLLLRNPDRIVTITGTHLRDDFDYVEALFDAVFLSFRTGPADGKGS